MSQKPEEASPSGPEPEIRFSEKFLRERNRERRKAMFGGGILVAVTGLIIIGESLYAHRTHTWVGLGRTLNEVFVPPIIGGLFGVLILLLGLYCLWDSRK